MGIRIQSPKKMEKTRMTEEDYDYLDYLRDEDNEEQEAEE